MLHFQDDPSLRNLIILKPNWVVDAVYSVLKNPNIRARGGQFSRSELTAVWQQYSHIEQGQLLCLMLKNNFEICYPTRLNSEPDQFIAPQLLPNIQPDYAWDTDDCLQFRFQYAFMPEGIITRLIVRLHHLILDNQVWQTGVVLSDQGCQAQVIEDEHNTDGLRVIDIQVNGPTQAKKYVLRKILDEIVAIQTRWFPQVKVDQMVPCICTACVEADVPHFYKFSVLQHFRNKGRTTIYCESAEQVSIQQLLEGLSEQHITPQKTQLNISRYQERSIQKKIAELAQFYKIVVVSGPRQSGKTTLVKKLFKHYEYINLEDIDERTMAEEDPRNFLASYPDKVIIDEVQRVPALLSYLQGHVDANPRNAQYILTGSSQIGLKDGVSQSLSGRSTILALLPFSSIELPKASQQQSLEYRLYAGSYPGIHCNHMPITDFYLDYIQTYLERDVSKLSNIQKLGTFQSFLKICAGHCGQIINYSSLAKDAGISPNTVKEWLNILELSYIIFRLQPYHKNYTKRLIKSPKLYFYDTGVACALLGIENEQDLATHNLKGGLFESWVISEYKKYYFNKHRDAPLYYWRDQAGHEIDLVIEQQKLHAFEIKSGTTPQQNFFKNLDYLRTLAGDDLLNQYVIYGGSQTRKHRQTQLLSWRDIHSVQPLPTSA